MASSMRKVLCDGGFDPLHTGHLAYLRAASAYGEVVCRIASDAEVCQKHTLVLPQAERAAIVGALPQVAGVLTHCSTLEALREGVWAYYVKGADWKGRIPADQIAVCHEKGIRIAYTQTVQRNTSSTYMRTHDAAAQKRFAQVAETQPQPRAWQPVTDYGYAARAKLEAPHADRIAQCLTAYVRTAKSVQRPLVLDYGCGHGYLIRFLAERLPEAICEGYDPQAYAGQHAAVRHTPPDLGTAYTLVICREVLEHVRLRDYALLVGRLCQYAAGLLYLTTRFHSSPRHVLDIATSDALDPTHITMPTKALLRALITMHGFRQRADLEAVLDWQKKGRVLVYERLA